MNPVSLLFTSLIAAFCSADSEFAPPGLVLVEGGKAEAGLDEEVAEELILEHESMVRAIWAETPLHKIEVEDFYLMVTEVTNEQYAEFVAATGAKPPSAWAAPSEIEKARAEFFEEEKRKRDEAKEAGRQAPPRGRFEIQEWWERNWEGAEWEVPEGRGNHPVTFIDYASATAYARWAGMRLMTEYEYQYAVRGDSENIYPWGNDWNDKGFAQTVHYGLDDTLPVGSFEAGATKHGVYDLAGSVWEWTSTPFEPFDKYEPHEIKVGKGRSARIIHAFGEFNANFRVCVGGSYRNEVFAARNTVRRGTSRFQATDASGFRCAASIEPGVDMADTVLREDLPPSRRPEDVEYDPSKTLAMDRWQTKEGTAEVDGYSVITGYDNVLLIPIPKLPINNEKRLMDQSLEAPVHVGVLSTTQKLVRPELEPGTYMVAFRAAGEPKKKRDDEEEGSSSTDDWLSEIDVELNNYLFFDTYGDFAGAVVCDEIDFGKHREPSIAVDRIRAPEDPEELEELAQQGIVIIERDEARFTMFVEGTSKRSGMIYTLPLGLEPGAADGSWRK